TVSAGITYVYDGRGRMKSAGTTTYAINGLGQRVKKNNGSDLFFAYDEAGHLIGEYDSTGAPIEETVWLGDLPVAVIKPKTPSGFDAFYIWTDNLGTPRQITDTTNQSRWEWPNADPFGNNQPNENPASLGAFNYNLRFPGQYYDAEKASNYNYFRDYDPGIGRYVESDPIGLGGGYNTYSYVASSPLRFADFLGLQAAAAGGAGAAGSGGAAVAGGTGQSTGDSGGSSGIGSSSDIARQIQELYHKWTCPPDCWEIANNIQNLTNELKLRYLQMTADKNNLYQTNVIGRMSWIGHQMQYNQKQKELRKWVQMAREQGCPYNLEAHKYMDLDPPDRPAR
ncbi:MAG TPA: RHS repeat-associated core domain-containing protein, partial [Anaeromyxobacteraceae bacterium]|nr:RHS repeat-associated core domain-containing protein [Anaeromyxobacteraceae bacterium]